MSTSEAKIRANRANAKRSTGPRTVAGKRRSRYDAVKHGWRSQVPIPAGEDAVMFEELRGQLIRSFDALTVPERLICARIALAIWRSFRAARAETHTITHIAASVADGPSAEDDPAATALSELFLSPGANTLPQMVRYERHLTREARDGIRMLKEIQAARRAHVEGTACLDVGTIIEGVVASPPPQAGEVRREAAGRGHARTARDGVGEGPAARPGRRHAATTRAAPPPAIAAILSACAKPTDREPDASASRVPVPAAIRPRRTSG